MSRAVLDASAVMALLQQEPGRAVVKQQLRDAVISAVNLAEVGARLADKGSSLPDIEATLQNLALPVEAFDADQARQSVALRFLTYHKGLSLGDRACLALAMREGVPALTADRSWSALDIGVEVHLIRG